MPSIMGNPHPMEFVELDDSIELRHEEFDAVRTIHMDAVEDPTTIALSPHGCSVGRWEGDTPVVSGRAPSDDSSRKRELVRNKGRDDPQARQSNSWTSIPGR